MVILRLALVIGMAMKMKVMSISYHFIGIKARLRCSVLNRVTCHIKTKSWDALSDNDNGCLPENPARMRTGITQVNNAHR